MHNLRRLCLARVTVGGKEEEEEEEEEKKTEKKLR